LILLLENAMKLETSIALTADGKVIVEGLNNGKRYEFRPDTDGAVTGEVDDEDTLVHLLTNCGTRFWPADEADYDAAKVLLDKSVVVDDDDEAGQDLDDDENAELQPGADPLVEAKTPPAVIPGRKPRAARKTANPE
jgi:hypothetical protein